MVRPTLVLSLIACGLVAVVSAGFEKPIDNVRTLAGDWGAVAGTSKAMIHINEDGTYEGTAATGARTTGKVTVTEGKASYRSTTSEGTVTLSEEDGKDVLTFVSDRGSAKLQRVK